MNFRLLGPIFKSLLIEFKNDGNNLVSASLEIKLEKGVVYYKNRNKRWARLDIRVIEKRGIIE